MVGYLDQSYWHCFLQSGRAQSLIAKVSCGAALRKAWSAARPAASFLEFERSHAATVQKRTQVLSLSWPKDSRTGICLELNSRASRSCWSGYLILDSGQKSPYPGARRKEGREPENAARMPFRRLRTHLRLAHR